MAIADKSSLRQSDEKKFRVSLKCKSPEVPGSPGSTDVSRDGERAAC